MALAVATLASPAVSADRIGSSTRLAPPSDLTTVGSTGAAQHIDRGLIEHILAGWKDEPRQTAIQVLAKYGLPDEATPERLVWHNNGPWKVTMLVNEEIPHYFPKPHHDFLYQAIYYHVPLDMFDDLAFYDGSVIVERTKGTIAARCDKEENNFLALNLADEIIRGKRSVDSAREFYAETIIQMQHQEYTKGFLFSVPQEPQNDPDHPVRP
jgi:hypothetical protein